MLVFLKCVFSEVIRKWIWLCRGVFLFDCSVLLLFLVMFVLKCVRMFGDR